MFLVLYYSRKCIFVGKVGLIFLNFVFFLLLAIGICVRFVVEGSGFLGRDGVKSRRVGVDRE